MIEAAEKAERALARAAPINGMVEVDRAVLKELLGQHHARGLLAERYTWLRDRDPDTIEQGGVFAGQTPQDYILTGEDLDRAIDAARKTFVKSTEGEAAKCTHQEICEYGCRKDFLQQQGRNTCSPVLPVRQK